MSSSRRALSAPPAHDLLTRGVILALIGLVLLIAPHFMHATALRDMFVGARIVGWFALVLGLAFMGQFLLRRRKARQDQAQAPASTPTPRKKR